MIKVEGRDIPFAVANHPSFFYNVIDDSAIIPPQNYDQLSVIMRQDLIAARWQVRMSAAPDADPNTVMNECIAYYDSNDGARVICEQVYIQGFGLTPGEAAPYCSVPRLLPLAERKEIESKVEQLAEEMGANDGNETEALQRYAARVLTTRSRSAV